MKMNETFPVRSWPANASVLALVIALALLVAPACAPLCAASACSSGGERQGQCHDMAGMGSNGGEQFVGASKACGAADFSAVLVKANEQSSLSREARIDAAPAIISGSPEHGLGSFDETPGRWGLHRIPLKSAGLLLPTTILRI
jgi:hypothetical protein